MSARSSLFSFPAGALLLAMMMLAVSGCGSVSPKSRMGEVAIDYPGSWAASKEGKSGVDAEWIRRFGDKKLTSLVDEALRNNHDLRAAAARVEQARGQARLVGADANPKADLVFDGSRTQRNFIGFPFGDGPGGGESVASSRSNNFGLSLDVNWEIDLWGRIAAGKSAAIGLYEAAGMDERAARSSLAAQVAKTWFALLEAQAQLKLSTAAEKVYDQTVQAVKERFKAGQQENGAAANLRLAETDLANARANTAERRQQLETVSRQLETLLGRYPAGELKAENDLPTVPSKPPAGLPSELLQRRPDVLAAERRFAAQGKRLSEARRALFPRLSLTASGGTSTDDLNQLLNSNFGVWQLAGNAIQPVLTGGALRAEADIRRAEEKEALAQLQQTVLQAFSEVEISLAVDRHLAARQEAVADAAKSSQEADTAARADYRDGVGDILTLLAAQNRLLQSRSLLLTVHRLRLENRVDLHLALGGDYQPRPQGTQEGTAKKNPS